MNRRSLKKCAMPTSRGFEACVYSLDSLWMKIASGIDFKIARIPSMLARQMFNIALTKEASSVRHSFHQPCFAEKRAVIKISFTGVQYLMLGYRAAKAAAYSAKNLGKS